MAYNATVGERTLRELYLTAFEIAITQSHAGAVMTAYNKVNGQYCFGNTHLVGDILRGEWQYDGLVVSDWGGSYNLPAGLAAGSDLEMPACKFGPAEVRQALQNGTVSEEQIHTSAGHIVQMAQKCAAILPVSYTPKAHDALAVRAAEKSCVLLKNSGILPLQPQSKVAVIGDFAFEPVIQGGGSSHVNCAQTANLIEALKQEDVQLIGAERGFCKSGKKKNTLAKKAVALAAQADTVIYCMGTGDHELEEGYDRTNIHLMPVQVQLLIRLQAVCSHIVVVLFCGDVVQTDWDNNVDAVLLAGYGGQGACRAVAHLLVGKANPCGKLAQSWYESMADIPHLSTYSPVFNKAEHAEGLEVGYRNQTAKIKYPFGYGLSYTTFAYSHLIVQEDGVTFTLKNTGNRDGYEVVQLYVGFPFYPSVPQLKGFASVFVKAGEEKQVELAFDNYTFRTYLNGWHIFAGEYTICVGGQFGNFPLQTTVQRGGETPSKQQLAALNTPETPVENTVQTAEPTDCYSHLYKKVKVSPTLPFRQLKHAKGFSAKLMYFFMWLATLSKNKVERKSMEYLPIRSIMQFAPFNENQAQGFMMMLNGKFFRGLARLIKNDKNDKKDG
jgi:beta-glucosidase